MSEMNWPDAFATAAVFAAIAFMVWVDRHSYSDHEDDDD